MASNVHSTNKTTQPVQSPLPSNKLIMFPRSPSRDLLPDNYAYAPTSIQLHDHTNYPVWARIISTHLRLHHVWAIITGSETMPTSGISECREFRHRQALARRLLMSSLSNHLRSTVAQYNFTQGLSDPKVLWETLEEWYGDGKDGRGHGDEVQIVG
ncbi:hypothetical protein K440DRAFT_668530 [Wilcoxina mikolae CBS 423.85]|nr:hypothetical protein K440DRAFT_668530 [Wilcoxina mikolae CBS 423.85]